MGMRSYEKEGRMGEVGDKKKKLNDLRQTAPWVLFTEMCYLITFSFLPILMKAAMARSSCSRVCAADN